MSGKLDKIVGHGKEAAGEATDNKDLRREGRLQQFSGDVKEKTDDAADKTKDKVDDMSEALKGALRKDK
ncbi:MAG: CsbD-like [Thermoleophilia bacterium]|nr:CsbD-like [Thermoleophilia bacterium]MCZ4496870.1 CsbD-like [Thermoleophilia bacterium]